MTDPSPPPRRRLEFAPKTQVQRRHRDTAVAWITAQQPGRMFEGANVTAAIHRALKEAGYVTDQHHIKMSMTALEREGWAEQLIVGRRVRLFILKDDVDVPEPTFVAAGRRMATATARPAAEAGRRPPPLPRRGPEVPTVFAELGQAILDWWRLDPSGAEAWASDALRELQ